MMKIEFAKSFKKSYKKISAENKEIFKAVLKKLANNEILEPKYKDHYLVGKYKGFKECHLKPDLLLIYKVEKEKLTLYCVNIGSHSELGLTKG